MPKVKPKFDYFFIINTALIASHSANELEAEKMELSKDIQNICSKNDCALKELMQELSECIIEISKEYQEIIQREINVIAKCTELGPVGEHWDELTQYRIQASELKEELSKYEVLIQKVGQMAYNQAVTSLLSGIENAMELLDVHFCNLEKILTELTKDNYNWEIKLLHANRDSILQTLK